MPAAGSLDLGRTIDVLHLLCCVRSKHQSLFSKLRDCRISNAGFRQLLAYLNAPEADEFATDLLYMLEQTIIVRLMCLRRLSATFAAAVRLRQSKLCIS